MTESLSQCCDALESAVELLSGTVSKLENQSNLSNQLTMSLLQPRRVFELIPEYDIQRAKLDLIEEVEPLVKSLSGKLSKSLVKLERERDTLQQTLELNSLRLNNQFSGEEMSDPDVSSDLVIMTSSTTEELDQLKKLKAQKAQLISSIQEIQSGEQG
ncbi:Spc19p [Lachancea thermotolerans CBS 6340]|uniref:DASH complex subunit SPC19 n=1 Tax=Lachancea thermotolerans (strain ATCC 56472 / CBS 6340 / NRRL Y-8284) TaxID=559295 RepID=C5DKX2_LACTC|nr:KLTH0F08228p [Lachancea thermotolerans CBS 6340]CAR24123.1 KLTH0F08228p [Lachancea thermotolerans CBS 6340]